LTLLAIDIVSGRFQNLPQPRIDPTVDGQIAPNRLVSAIGVISVDIYFSAHEKRPHGESFVGGRSSDTLSVRVGEQYGRRGEPRQGFAV
jgi:hypothetical protein